MGKFKDRLMITPQATILGWRKLGLGLIFSGQYVDLRTGVHRYRSYMEFDWLTHYPALSNHWNEHYLGELQGVYVTMFFEHEFKIQGKLI